MIPVDIQHLRRLNNLETLNASNTAIAALADDATRNAFLDQHEAECSALRDALWAIGHMKCWYSEASLQQCEGHVEHYRPKRRLSGARHGGYWWRAFDWRNLRLAHPTVNRRKTDYLSGKRVGKGSYFPLRDEARRASNVTAEPQEEPVLLDPINPSDTLLICFSEESGAPRPRFRADQDAWRHERAEKSIEYYHLDEASWNAKRADLMAEVKKLCERLQRLWLQEPRDTAEYNRTIDEIVAYLSPYAEFSAACRQVVRELGLLEHFATGIT